MTQKTVAILKVEGVRFAVAIVPDELLKDSLRSDDALCELERHFRCHPLLLGARYQRVFGRRETAELFERVPKSQILWFRWPVAA